MTMYVYAHTCVTLCVCGYREVCLHYGNASLFDFDHVSCNKL